MKTFDIEVLNSVVKAVDVSANCVYDSTTIYGLEDAVNLEAKYQLYFNLSSVADYLGINNLGTISKLVDRLYEANKDVFLEQAASSFQSEYA